MDRMTDRGPHGSRAMQGHAVRRTAARRVPRGCCEDLRLPDVVPSVAGRVDLRLRTR